MAAPSFISKGTLGSTTGASFSFTFPAGIASNDLLFLAVFDYGLGTITTNSSWTLISTMVYPTGSPKMLIKLYWKVASGSETGTQSVTRSGYAAGDFFGNVYQYRGDNFLTRESYSSYLSNSSTITWSATSVGGTERTLCAFVLNYSGSNPGTPTGYTQSASDTYNSSYLKLYTKQNVSSGASVTTTGGSTNGYFTFHVSIYNNTPSVGGSLVRSFIVN